MHFSHWLSYVVALVQLVVPQLQGIFLLCYYHMHCIFSNWITICCLFSFKGLFAYQSATFTRLASNQAFNSSSECLISVSNLKTHLKCLAVCMRNGACEMGQVDNTECRLYSCIKSDLVSRKGSFVYAKSNSSASSVPSVSTTTTNSTTSK